MKSTEIPSPIDRANIMVIMEGINALTVAINHINQIESLLPEIPSKGYTIVPKGEIRPLLISTCVYIGAAWKALFDDGANEQKKWLKIEKKKRQSSVIKQLEGIDYEPLSGSVIRNKVVHIEDHILVSARKNPEASWLVDIGLSHREAVLPEHGHAMNYCRVFIFSEGTILHLGSELNLYEYRKTAKLVVERLSGTSFEMLSQQH